jgi:hypothetical protein
VAADFPTAHKRNNAEGAEVVASLHDRDKRGRPAGLGVKRKVPIGIDPPIQIDGATPASRALQIIQDLRDPAKLLGPQNKIQKRDPFQESLTFLLGYASPHPDDELRVLPFEPSESAKRTIDFLFRFFSHAASIYENEVGLGRVVHLPAIPSGKDLGHPLGIIHVHLTSKGLNKKFFGNHRLFLLSPLRLSLSIRGIHSLALGRHLFFSGFIPLFFSLQVLNFFGQTAEVYG